MSDCRNILASQTNENRRIFKNFKVPTYESIFNPNPFHIPDVVEMIFGEEHLNLDRHVYDALGGAPPIDDNERNNDDNNNDNRKRQSRRNISRTQNNLKNIERHEKQSEMEKMSTPPNVENLVTPPNTDTETEAQKAQRTKELEEKLRNLQKEQSSQENNKKKTLKNIQKAIENAQKEKEKVKSGTILGTEQMNALLSTMDKNIEELKKQYEEVKKTPPKRTKQINMAPKKIQRQTSLSKQMQKDNIQNDSDYEEFLERERHNEYLKKRKQEAKRISKELESEAEKKAEKQLNEQQQKIYKAKLERDKLLKEIHNKQQRNDSDEDSENERHMRYIRKRAKEDMKRLHYDSVDGYSNEDSDSVFDREIKKMQKQKTRKRYDVKDLDEETDVDEGTKKFRNEDEEKEYELNEFEKQKKEEAYEAQQKEKAEKEIQRKEEENKKFEKQVAYDIEVGDDAKLKNENFWTENKLLKLSGEKTGKVDPNWRENIKDDDVYSPMLCYAFDDYTLFEIRTEIREEFEKYTYKLKTSQPLWQEITNEYKTQRRTFQEIIDSIDEELHNIVNKYVMSSHDNQLSKEGGIQCLVILYDQLAKMNREEKIISPRIQYQIYKEITNFFFNYIMYSNLRWTPHE